MSKTKGLKHATILFVYLLIVWGFYRSIFRFPEEIEEMIIKPIVWLIPVFYFVKKEGLSFGSVGITSKNLFSGLYLSLGLGALFVGEALLINFMKYKGLNFSANIGDKLLLSSIVISFATAFSEEVAFRGFIFSRVYLALGNELLANVLTSVAWTLVHLPVTIFIWKLNFASALIYLFLTFIFGIGSAFVYSRSKNVFASILLHVLWEWPIALFR